MGMETYLGIKKRWIRTINHMDQEPRFYTMHDHFSGGFYRSHFSGRVLQEPHFWQGSTGATFLAGFYRSHFSGRVLQEPRFYTHA